MREDASDPPNQTSERTSVKAAFLACERSLKGFIARLCRNQNDVDDFAHEALASAMKAEEVAPISHPEAYLYQTARNLVIRTHGKRAREIIGDVEKAIDRQLESGEPSVEEHVIGRERFALFCEAVATLPAGCRRVFVMRKVYGYSHKEISERLGIATSTVEKHLATGFARCTAFMRAREEAAESPAAVEGLRGRVDRAAEKRK